jgi:hypothetical protein
MSFKLRGARFEEQMERNEIIATQVATLKKLQEAMAVREKEKVRCTREIQQKKNWQISELARIEQTSKMEGPTISKGSPPAGYGGYLDGYCGAAL